MKALTRRRPCRDIVFAARAWGPGVDRRAAEVTLSRKGAKSRTHGRKLRSTGTKAGTRVGRVREPRTELEKKLAAHARELAEARTHLAQAVERETATSEVLRVISSSPGEMEPVFRAMLANAARICQAKFGTLFLSERDAFRVVAQHGAPPAYAEARRREPLVRGFAQGALGRAARTKQATQIADLRAEPGYIDDPQAFAILNLAGARTMLAVPMLKENELVGAIAIYRQEVRPFTDKQIALLTNFAAQAVIAIENTRLLNELRQRTDDLSEALEQQTATPKVLGIISSSPGELEPVFDTMLENAVQICDASFGNLLLYDGDLFRHVALHNAPPAWAAERQRDPIPPRHAARVLYSVADTKQVTHIADMALESPDEPIAKFGGVDHLFRDAVDF